MEKFLDNTSVFRVRKAEELVNRKHESVKQEYLEKIIAKIQAEHEESKEKGNVCFGCFLYLFYSHTHSHRCLSALNSNYSNACLVAI